jgi:hypothetical protein
MVMEFHISRAVRKRYNVSDSLFEFDGNAIFVDPAASRRLAARLNEARDPNTAGFVHASSLFAMGLIDELSHALFAYYRRTVDPKVLTEALSWFASHTSSLKLNQLIATFADHFPNVAVYRGELTVDEWLNATTDSIPHREAALEELLLLWLANINPAFKPFKELFDDQPLARSTVYASVTTSLDGYFETRPTIGP